MPLLIAKVSLLVLAIIWVVYPAGVWLFGRLRRAPASVSLPGRPKVSVVIASRADNAAIEARIRDVLGGDYPPDLLEVVVAVDPARDSHTLPISPDPRVQVILGDAPGGKAATLNAGVRASRGDVLIFSDTAQRFAPDAITTLVDSLADPAIGIVSGSLELTSDGGLPAPSVLYWAYERWVRRSEARLDSAVGVTGAIYAVRRELWPTLPPGLILDDLYVPMAAVLRGFRVGFNAHATATDPRAFSPAEEFRRKSRTLTGVVQLCAWMPSVLLPWRNRIWLQFVMHKLLRLTTPYLLLALLISLVVEAWAHRTVDSSMLWGLTLIGMAGVLAVANRAIRTSLSTVVLSQLAVVRALFHGARGEWDVWQS